MSEAQAGGAVHTYTIIGTTDANGKAVAVGPSTPIPSGTTSSTATVTSVNDTASSTTLLSANTARKGFTIFNDSTVVCYVKFGTTASTTSYTFQIAAGGYYESPTLVYTGRIDAIWASDASGAARITELT